MDLFALQTFLLCAGAGLSAAAFAAAMLEDWTCRRIPNRLVALAAAGALPAFLAGSVAAATGALVSALLLFLLAAFAFERGLVGGGDVKLLCAAGLWAGPEGAPALLLAQALATLLLVPAMWAAGQAGSNGAALPGFPLGIAIGSGGLAAIVFRIASYWL